MSFESIVEKYGARLIAWNKTWKSPFQDVRYVEALAEYYDLRGGIVKIAPSVLDGVIGYRILAWKVPYKYIASNISSELGDEVISRIKKSALIKELTAYLEIPVDKFKPFLKISTMHAYTLVIPLQRPLQYIWHDFSKSLRREINISERKGVKVRRAKPHEGYELYRGIALEKGLIVRPLELLNILSEKGLLRCYTATLNGSILASLFVLCTNKVTTYWLGGYHKKYSKYYPHSLCFWYAIRESRERGADIFDMGGIEYPPTKHAIFKYKFGGFLVKLYRLKVLI